MRYLTIKFDKIVPLFINVLLIIVVTDILIFYNNLTLFINTLLEISKALQKRWKHWTPINENVSNIPFCFFIEGACPDIDAALEGMYDNVHSAAEVLEGMRVNLHNEAPNVHSAAEALEGMRVNLHNEAPNVHNAAEALEGMRVNLDRDTKLGNMNT